MKSSLSLVMSFALLWGCASQQPPEFYSEGQLVQTESRQVESTGPGVTAVSVEQNETGQYTFSVTIESEETGCDRYANWWEVITEEGTLLYRRILAHSHVDEQPFTRSGGPVEIAADDVVIVRSHMHPTGYHTQAMKGSFTTGFAPVILPADFAPELAEADPLPTGCTF
ncbi:MAG: hypothetical protein AAFQ74_08285 [Cyanobacteria bacterium J06623_4]